MFEGLQAIGAAWRAILHLSEWSGLSLGMLAGLAALVYFDPKTLKLAIVGAVAILIGWSCLVHGHSVGVTDEDAKLKTISEQNDARASTAATQDESALVSAIEAKAKEQHDADLAEIARLRSNGAPGCAFDPGADDDGVRAGTSGAPSRPVDSNAEPAGSTKATDKSPAVAPPRRRLSLPLVPRRWLPWQGSRSHAAPDSQ